VEAVLEKLEANGDIIRLANVLVNDFTPWPKSFPIILKLLDYGQVQIGLYPSKKKVTS
jgi:hypothetical protein